MRFIVFSMCFGETEYAWDDRIAMRAALSELLEIPGPTCPPRDKEICGEIWPDAPAITFGLQ
ncbi:MAG TPA: hypothetical protein VIS10_14965 [Anaerolineales bacterium]